jgi:enoyl-CoA hydratase/carnithine racemase
MTGLNETQLGLNPPWWICDLMKRQVGDAIADRMLQRGTLVDAERAQELGLVCDAVGTVEELDAAVTRHIKEMLAVPDSARQAVKAERRAGLGDAMAAGVREGSDWFVNAVTSEPVQGPIAAYAASLKQ